jgi:RNA polymerase sigma-70 factor, ECF subfamily
MVADGNVTQLLAEYSSGNKSVLDDLFPLVYDELRRVAANRLVGENSNHTLQPTALVHEAYMRLINQHSVDWRNRAHFFSIAAEMMRRILVNHALEKNAKKRGGGYTTVALNDAVTFAKESNINLAELDEALTELESFAPRQAKIIELRFFGGLGIEETAEVTDVSSQTVKRDWRAAKAWLHARLYPG